MMKIKKLLSPSSWAIHTVLIAYTLIAILPVFLILYNSFKDLDAIFDTPLALPTFETFTLIGYDTVFTQTNFLLYFVNSLVVTLGTLVIVILFGAMTAFFLSEYNFKGNVFLTVFITIGIMIPIRLGTVSILKMMVAMDLTNNLISLILVYSAQGIPLAVFIMSEFMNQVPSDLKDAGRIDGLSEYSIFFRIVFPLVRPVAATVGIFTMIPLWNDLWFPLILTSSDSTKTITLGAQQFLGQFVTDWNAVLASLSMAMFPALLLYLVFSRQLIRGITSGAVK